MAYGIILGLHIGAALATLGGVVYALYAIVGENRGAYRWLAYAIGTLAVFEVISGTLLAGVSPNVSLLQLTSHIVAYLIVCAAVEVLLYERMRKTVWIF